MSLNNFLIKIKKNKEMINNTLSQTYDDISKLLNDHKIFDPELTINSQTLMKSRFTDKEPKMKNINYTPRHDNDTKIICENREHSFDIKKKNQSFHQKTISKSKENPLVVILNQVIAESLQT